MNEEFLWYLWKYQLFNAPLITTKGNTFEVIHPGTHNTDSGPDFFNGRIKLHNTTWAGNIEIHTLSSDWYKHNHSSDPAYDNIVLHVVYRDDKPVHRKNTELIPTIEVKDKFEKAIFNRYHSFVLSKTWIACQHFIGSVNHFRKFSWLERIMVERLEEKTESINLVLRNSKQDFTEVFYQRLLRNFGFKTNGQAFETLANSLLFGILAKHTGNQFQLEALLFGQAGLLHERYKDGYARDLFQEYEFLAGKYSLTAINPGTIKFMRMRPSNFPTLRISQFANVLFRAEGLLHKILEAEKLNEVFSLFKCQASVYWEDHYRFDKLSKKSAKLLGKGSIHLILINTVIPFLFVYGKIKNNREIQNRAIEWLEKIPAEKNAITNGFKNAGLEIHHAMHSQSLLQLKSSYCDRKRCLECGIGHGILKPEKAIK